MIKKTKKATKKRRTPMKAAIKKALAVHVDEIMSKAAQHDAALEYFRDEHKPQTSIDDVFSVDGSDCLTVIMSYLVERSNSMQKTIEEIETRERTRAEAAVKRYGQPRSITQMTRTELEEELARYRIGARDNY